MTVVMITQFMEEALGADRVFVLSEGRLVMEGTPKEVFNERAMLEESRLDAPAFVKLRDELLAAGDIPLLEENAAQVVATATQEITLADAEIARLQRDIAEAQASLRGTLVDRNILALGADITELNERRLQFRAHRTDMVKRAEEICLV